ncbi:hypothetical protein M3J09_010637 [Ascochyta lentis]
MSVRAVLRKAITRQRCYGVGLVGDVYLVSSHSFEFLNWWFRDCIQSRSQSTISTSTPHHISHIPHSPRHLLRHVIHHVLSDRPHFVSLHVPRPHHALWRLPGEDNAVARSQL